MNVTFWGVRSTIPVPGPATLRYGGNTACVSIALHDGALLMIDCGTGARNFGNRLASGGAFAEGRGQCTMLLSLAHWDHIQGFPFFVPLYRTGNGFDVHGLAADAGTLESILERQMAAQYFPVQTIRNMGASVTMHPVRDGQWFSIGSARVIAKALPGPADEARPLAFRVEADGRALAYVGHHALVAPDHALPDVIAGGVDLLIHDTDGESDEGLLRAAQTSGARRLALFHYDPDDSDHRIDERLATLRRRVDQSEGPARALQVIGAYEGLTIEL